MERSVIERVPKQSAVSIRRLLARHMARTAGKTVMSPENPRQIARKRMDAGADRLPTPDDIKIESTTLAGLNALSFTPDDHRPGLLLFLHGGGYCLGSPKSHRPLVTRLAKALKIKASLSIIAWRLSMSFPAPSKMEPLRSTGRCRTATAPS
jgi:monoterpene epsilon-lactone hydrolase